MIRLSIASTDFTVGFSALLAQARETTETVDRAVASIIADVRARDAAALIDYTARFDRLTLIACRLRIRTKEIDAAVASVPPPALAALGLAAARMTAAGQRIRKLCATGSASVARCLLAPGTATTTSWTETPIWVWVSRRARNRSARGRRQSQRERD
jgi:histidinol dehydrogenase